MKSYEANVHEKLNANYRDLNSTRNYDIIPPSMPKFILSMFRYMLFKEFTELYPGMLYLSVP